MMWRTVLDPRAHPLFICDSEVFAARVRELRTRARRELLEFWRSDGTGDVEDMSCFGREELA